MIKCSWVTVKAENISKENLWRVSAEKFRNAPCWKNSGITSFKVCVCVVIYRAKLLNVSFD